VWLSVPASTGDGGAPSTIQPVSGAAPAPPRFAAAGAAIAPAEARTRLAELKVQLEEADRTYCSYVRGSRYPLSSRPASEQADQLYPNRPVVESRPMRLDGGGANEQVMVQTSQTRVYLAAGESASFSIQARDAQGRVLPLQVTRSVAQGLTFNGARAGPQATLVFADSTQGASATLSPAQTGLAGFAGTIRTEVRYNAGGRNGFAFFDVIYSPELPATWTGQVREALEDGSLHFYLKADIRTAGRYLVNGRVDDANGKPFALATFNDVLPAGQQEVRLTVFGKLLHDGQPALPLVLRDVDGYLLKENVDPDRALMPRLEGRVAVSKRSSLGGISDAEYDGEERRRHIAEFSKDLREARVRLAAAAPSEQPPPGCDEAARVK
jgi:hypothetical protein